MSTYVECVAIAALLHDIGKFWSRTRQDPPFTKSERDHFGTYAHALWSAHFIERHIGDSDIANWVRMHHAPDSRESMIISLADWLSSSERSEDAAMPRDQASAARLTNLLASLDGTGGVEKASPLPLTVHGDFAAHFMPADAEDGKDRYSHLWDAFEAHLRQLDTGRLRLATWLALIHRFCFRIPSATPTVHKGFIPDINLYDHSRTVAALASCFAIDAMTESRASELRTALANPSSASPALNEPVCQLVCGNLSGIQEFLYDVSTKGAAKALSGRSFALQLICDAAAAYLCETHCAPVCCIVYNGGGRFILLLPLAADVARCAEDLERFVHEQFQGRLSLLLGAVPLASVDFTATAFAQKWADANRAADSKKQTKFTRLAAAGYDRVFGFVDEDPHSSAPPADDAEDNLSDDDRFYIQLGEQLRRAAWLVRTTHVDKHAHEGLHHFYSRIGFAYQPLPDLSSIGDAGPLLEVTRLGELDLESVEQARRFSSVTALSYRLNARPWPRNNAGGTATFEELAQASRGIRKLGIVRADVDNLGALFARGLGGRATLSRVASLSASLSDFFEGYLQHLCCAEYPGSLGVVYSGGDDLFVLGAWNHAIDFAVRLREDFDRYCGGNPALSFSAGVVVVHDRLPLRLFADFAHEAEEKAKRHQRNGTVKNAVTLFDTAIGFEELGRFRAFAEELAAMLEPPDGGQGVPQSLLRKLYDVWDAYLKERQLIQKRSQGAPMDQIKASARWQRWRWNLVYSLRRFETVQDGIWRDRIKALQDRLLNDAQPIEDRLGVPLRWAELLLRKEK